MSCEDPIFKGHDKYGKNNCAKGDFGQGVYQTDTKPAKNITKCDMDKSHGKPSGK